MRKEASETSEMVNQAIFGDTFSILEQDKIKGFTRISLDHDHYEGWISKGSYTSAENDITDLKTIILHDLFTVLYSKDKSDQLILGCGSRLRTSTPGMIHIENKTYILPETKEEKAGNLRDQIVSWGLKLLSLPYIWGGRSSFGFDCSGLCQNLYSQAGIAIPRDASQQAGVGKTRSFIAEAVRGDLAFFDNDNGEIIHVGMILDEGKILHSSGKVKIDSIDHQGIYSASQNRYTHKLRLVKNLLD